MNNRLLNSSLLRDYAARWAAMTINPSARAEVELTAARLLALRPNYSAVSTATGVPWEFIAILHCLECDSDFNLHLHNGDPLAARTVHVPKGRPLTPPPWTWQESAIDALQCQGFNGVRDWTIPTGMLYRFEIYNGLGYYKRGVPSPYLWSGSNQYRKGKYAADGVYDPELVSGQIGAAVLLYALRNKEEGS